jgi:hypothetical protein
VEGGRTNPIRKEPTISLYLALATPAGLEPATCRLEGGCSIQLSYGARGALRRSGEFAGVLLT